MGKNPFIFSDERKYRLLRHFSFWIFWWLFQGFLYSFIPATLSAPFGIRLLESTIESLIYLPAHLFLAYSLMYFVVPRFLLTQRYWSTAFWTIILFLVTASISSLLAFFVISPVRTYFYKSEPFSLAMLTAKTFFLSLLAGLRGGITIGGLAAAIKLMKYWYVKEQRNLQLVKENAEAKLQLLKAQVHPHFLFNTLNNLYSLTLTGSDKTPLVVSHLSDLLRFMLYECDEAEILLATEIEVLKKYVELEKLRYGNRIDVSFVCSGTTSELMIAPLLLLPFVENSFKHGISDQLDQCWINLHLHADHNQLSFHLSNSYSKEKSEALFGGIGLQNIKKRLELLYNNRYELSVTEEEDIYVVKLRLQLNQVSRQYAPATAPSFTRQPIAAV